MPISLQARDGNWYAALYGQFDELGEYRIVIYGEDIVGLRSRPRELRLIRGSRIFLPFIAN